MIRVALVYSVVFVPFRYIMLIKLIKVSIAVFAFFFLQYSGLSFSHLNLFIGITVVYILELHRSVCSSISPWAGK